MVTLPGYIIGAASAAGDRLPLSPYEHYATPLANLLCLRRHTTTSAGRRYATVWLLTRQLLVMAPLAVRCYAGWYMLAIRCHAAVVTELR